jgi:adenine-specific DNA methylase
VKATRSRRLAIWSALPPYLGGKRRLCPLIFREIDRLVPRRFWRGLAFVDGFLGGGSVSLYAKAQGFRVVATDIAARAITVGEALIANSRVRLTREDVLRLARDGGEPAGRVEREYVPSTFTREQSRFLDRALAVAAEAHDPAKAALTRLLAIRVALLAHPMSQVRAGTIHRISTGEYEAITESCLYHYVDGLRLTRPTKLWDLAQQLNAGVFQGEGRVIRASIIDMLPEIHAHVAYFDPPYPGVMSYEKEYRVIDEILEGHSRPTSPFTAKCGAAMLDALFERAVHIPVWILSLGNAVVGIEELEAKMTRLGRETKAIAIKYQHLPAVATDEKKRENREFVIVGWDASAPLLRRPSVEDDRSRTGVDHADGLAVVEDDPCLGGAELPAFEPGLGDGGEESEAGLGEEIALGFGHAVPESEGRADDPDAIA